MKPALGIPALKILNFVKPALGMPALPPVPQRTTLVKFFKLDVDFGFFIFSELDPYKTHSSPSLNQKRKRERGHFLKDPVASIDESF